VLFRSWEAQAADGGWDGTDDAEVFPENEQRASHRFADDGEDGFIFEFAGQHTGRGEAGHEQSDGENDAHAHLNMLDGVIVERIGGRHDAEQQEERTGDVQHDHNRLAQAFDEGVSGNAKQLLQHRQRSLGAGQYKRGSGWNCSRNKKVILSEAIHGVTYPPDALLFNHSAKRRIGTPALDA